MLILYFYIFTRGFELLNVIFQASVYVTIVTVVTIVTIVTIVMSPLSGLQLY